MKGYIYITGVGTNPGHLNNLDDPELLGKTPTFGACMPNIRRFVEPGDYVFVVSGKTPGVSQYVIGGMQVAEKIDAKSAFRRFPDNRLRSVDGRVKGNVIIQADGSQHALDGHKPNEFKGRTVDFLVGKDPIVLKTPAEVELGRNQTVPFLSKMLQRAGERPIDIIGRMRKLDETQVHAVIDWLKGLRRPFGRSPRKTCSRRMFWATTPFVLF